LQSKAVLDKLEKNKEGKKGDTSEDEEGGEVDKGPSLCSIDQSAITGESLASDKFIVSISIYGFLATAKSY